MLLSAHGHAYLSVLERIVPVFDSHLHPAIRRPVVENALQRAAPIKGVFLYMYKALRQLNMVKAGAAEERISAYLSHRIAERDRLQYTAVEAVGRNILTAAITAEAAARACDRARRAVKGLGDSLVILEARKSRILTVRAG